MTGTALTGSPAHGAVGPVDDLATLARELLEPRVLSADLVASATGTAFPGLSGVLPGFGRQEPNDWGLGFEVRGAKEPHWTSPRNSPATFGHFGQSGSFLWVDPDARLACATAGDTPFGPWAADHWPRLADRLLDHHASAATRSSR
jgi:CubicO group peptidase (beta-lactamase class C family)